MSKLFPSDDEKESYGREFILGLGSAVITMGITYPISKIIFRQILHKISAYNAIKQLQREGLKYLFRGFLPPLFEKSLNLSMMFGINNEVKSCLKQFNLNCYEENLAGGIASGAMETICMPLGRIQILLVDSKYHKNFKNMFHAFKVVRRQYGIREYYRGFGLVLFRNMAANTTFFISKREIEKYTRLSEKCVYKEIVVNFCCGALVGGSLSTLFYPIKVIKVYIQKQLGGQFYPTYKIIQIIYGQNGGKITNFYQGVVANCTKSLLSWGVTNSSYEYLKLII